MKRTRKKIHRRKFKVSFLGIEIGLVIAAFLSVFFGRDWGFYNFLCLSPLLVSGLVIHVFSKIWGYFTTQRHSLESIHAKDIIGIFLGLICIILLVVFRTEIIYLREIVYFNQHADEFNEAIVNVFNVSNCAAQSDGSCEEYIPLDESSPRSGLVLNDHVKGEFALAIFSRKYTHYVYYPEQTSPPRFRNIHRYVINCDIQLNQEWYVCGVSG